MSNPRLLLIDNDSDTLIELRALCDAAGYDVTTVHCTRLDTLDGAPYDMLLLSGGYWYDDELQHVSTYADELALIRTSTTPILGVCLGMQLMHVAFSGNVPLLDTAQSGPLPIRLTPAGQEALGLPAVITVHKNHTRGIISALEHFDVLAYSQGHLEIMKHKTRPLLGVQFHPEIGRPESNLELFQRLIAACTGGLDERSE